MLLVLLLHFFVEEALNASHLVVEQALRSARSRVHPLDLLADGLLLLWAEVFLKLLDLSEFDSNDLVRVNLGKLGLLMLELFANLQLQLILIRQTKLVHVVVTIEAVLHEDVDGSDVLEREDGQAVRRPVHRVPQQQVLEVLVRLVLGQVFTFI